MWRKNKGLTPSLGTAKPRPGTELPQVAPNSHRWRKNKGLTPSLGTPKTEGLKPVSPNSPGTELPELRPHPSHHRITYSRICE